jgi:hypothetical protein
MHHETTLHYLQRELDTINSQVAGQQRLIGLINSSQSLHEQLGIGSSESANDNFRGGLDQLQRQGTYYTPNDNGADNYGAPDNAQIEQMRQASDLSTQFAQTFGANADSINTSAQNMASVAGGAFQSLTGTFKSQLPALIEGRENAGEALQGMLHETLLSVATESAVKALFEGAAAIASAAGGNYPAAGQHAIAAGMYAGVAVAAGVGAAISTPHPATASAVSGASSSGRSAGTGPSADSGGSNVTNIVNVNGFAMTHEGVQDSVAGALDKFMDRRPQGMRNMRRRAA